MSHSQNQNRSVLNRSVLYWSLYDFANSFVYITFLLYFSKWLVVTKGLSDWWYNATFIVGSIFLIFLAPYLGSRADKLKKGRKYLAYSTLLCFIFYAAAIWSAIKFNSPFVPAALFGLGNMFYQLAFVFYNPVLDAIAHDSVKGKISGFGFMANYLGQIAGILLALPLVSAHGPAYILGMSTDPLLLPLVPATMVFGILSLPLLLHKRAFIHHEVDNVMHGSRGVLQLLKEILMNKAVLYFMIAFFLFSDAITTIINNFSIFISNIFTVSDTQASILALLIIIGAGVGALFWGWLSDRIGSVKTISIILFTWVILIPVVALCKHFGLFVALCALAGICMGGTWSVSRRVLLDIAPKASLHAVFGVYAISERAATFVGPIAWSMMLGVFHYRGAMASMVIFQIGAVYSIMICSKHLSKMRK